MEFKIENKIIGSEHPVFFIAEAGVKPQWLNRSWKKLIDVAFEAGADAVKFQTFNTENYF